MCTSTTRKNKNTKIRPIKSRQICMILLFSKRMIQSLGILFKGPIGRVFVDISPVETIAAVRRVSEIVNLVASLLESLHHLRKVFVPPT